MAALLALGSGPIRAHEGPRIYLTLVLSEREEIGASLTVKETDFAEQLPADVVGLSLEERAGAWLHQQFEFGRMNGDALQPKVQECGRIVLDPSSGEPVQAGEDGEPFLEIEFSLPQTKPISIRFRFPPGHEALQVNALLADVRTGEETWHVLTPHQAELVYPKPSSAAGEQEAGTDPATDATRRKPTARQIILLAALGVGLLGFLAAIVVVRKRRAPLA